MFTGVHELPSVAHASVPAHVLLMLSYVHFVHQIPPSVVLCRGAVLFNMFILFSEF